jgi:hypothetical protein
MSMFKYDAVIVLDLVEATPCSWDKTRNVYFGANFPKIVSSNVAIGLNKDLS